MTATAVTVTTCAQKYSQPVNQPSGPVRQALRPLVDRPRDREVARQLGEDERHEQLADDDDRPRPEERRATEPDADAEVAERPGRNADEAERDREVRQEPQGSLRSSGLMPEGSQVGVVALGDVRRLRPGPDTASSLYHRDSARLWAAERGTTSPGTDTEDRGALARPLNRARPEHRSAAKDLRSLDEARNRATRGNSPPGGHRTAEAGGNGLRERGGQRPVPLHRLDVPIDHRAAALDAELVEQERDLLRLGGEDLVLRLEVPSSRLKRPERLLPRRVDELLVGLVGLRSSSAFAKHHASICSCSSRGNAGCSYSRFWKPVARWISAVSTSRNAWNSSSGQRRGAVLDRAREPVLAPGDLAEPLVDRRSRPRPSRRSRRA